MKRIVRLTESDLVRLVSKVIDESSTKKHKAQKLIDNILSTQGKKTDQRPVDKRKIYKEDELSSMDYDQIHGIWQKIHHPAGRGW